jgi:hypothetical protein
MEKPKSYRQEDLPPCDRYPNGASIIVANGRTNIFPKDNPEVIKGKVRKTIELRLEIFKELIEKKPEFDSEFFERAYAFKYQIFDAFRLALNTLEEEDVADLRENFSELLKRVSD